MLVGLAIVLSIVTALLAWLAIHLYLGSRRILRTGVQVPGVVVDHVKYPGKNRGMPTTASVVEFKTLDGSPGRFESSVRTYPARYQIGAAVSVVYVQGGESEPRIADFQELWLPSILTGVLAFGAMIFALVCVWGATRPDA